MTEALFTDAHHHPAYAPIYASYKEALVDWQANAEVRKAAATLGMDVRAYADSRIRGKTFTWAGSYATPDLTQQHFDTAYEQASGEVFV